MLTKTNSLPVAQESAAGRSPASEGDKIKCTREGTGHLPYQGKAVTYRPSSAHSATASARYQQHMTTPYGYWAPRCTRGGRVRVP